MTYKTAFISVKEYIENYRDAEKFIALCEKCNRYNLCWACPPFDFDPLSILLQHQNAYIIGIQVIIENNPKRKNSKDKIFANQLIHDIFVKTRASFDKRLLTLEKENFGSRAFFAGSCFNCSDGECARSLKLPCIQPDKVRYSLEAFGFDITKTASELLHFELQWGNEKELPEYLTLVGGLFTNQQGI